MRWPSFRLLPGRQFNPDVVEAFCVRPAEMVGEFSFVALGDIAAAFACFF